MDRNTIQNDLPLKERIPLQLTPHDNVLQNIILKEPIELTLLDKLIHCPSLLKKTFHDPMSTALYKGGEHELLNHYRKLWRKNWIDVQYVRNEKIDYGRFLPSRARGLHNIRRELRHTLAAEWAVDNDIANCHPKILQQIKNIHDIKADYLDEYCANREDWLKEVVKDYDLHTHPTAEENPKYPREMAKVLFIILAYGGGTDRWKKKHKIFVKDSDGKDTEEVAWAIKDRPDTAYIKNYKLDMGRIQKRICDANPHLKQQVIDLKLEYDKAEGSYNLAGSVCSYYLQEWEGRILEVMYRYCLDKKYIRDGEVVLCADGIMLMKKHYHDGIPAELEIEIKRQLGFELEIEKKAMNNGYTAKDIRNALDFKLQEGQFLTGRVANVFRILYSNKFTYHEGNLRKYNGTYWEKEIGKANTSLHDFVNTTFHQFLSNKLIKDLYKLSEEIGNMYHELNVAEEEDAKKSIKERIKTKEGEKKVIQAKLGEIEQNCCNIKKRRDLVADILHAITNPYIKWDDHPYKLAFTNRIIDIRTGDKLDSTYKDYISMTTKYDWSNYDLRERKQLIKKIIRQIFPYPDVRNYYMTALSTGLWGQQMENLFIATGVGGNGKSQLNELMLDAMGDYGYDMPKSVLQDEKKGGADPEVAKLHKRRFVVTGEPSQNKKIQTSTMKKITGNQSVEARMLYENGMDGGISLTLSLFLEANRLPMLDEITEGINRRVDVFPFVSRFLKNQSEYDKLTKGLNPEEIKASNLYLGNMQYKKSDWKADHRQALICILLEYYQEFHKNGECMPEQPKACEIAKMDYMAGSDDLFSWFEDRYERIPDGGANEGEIDVNNEDRKRVIYITGLFQTFKQDTEYLRHQTRETQKRYAKQGNFVKDIKENLFVSVFIKKRDTNWGGKTHTKDYIHSWRKKIVINTQDEDTDDDEPEYTCEAKGY